MKFSICRSSDCGKLNKPCDGAFGEEVSGKTRWFIHIDSMTDLLSLIEKEGKVIIDTEWEYHIEIYDDYRE